MRLLVELTQEHAVRTEQVLQHPSARRPLLRPGKGGIRPTNRVPARTRRFPADAVRRTDTVMRGASGGNRDPPLTPASVTQRSGNQWYVQPLASEWKKSPEYTVIALGSDIGITCNWRRRPAMLGDRSWILFVVDVE